MNGIICNTNANVTIVGSARKIGGIAGLSTQGIIRNCINYASISGEKYAGGICGYSQNTLIDTCGNEIDTFIEATYGYARRYCTDM